VPLQADPQAEELPVKDVVNQGPDVSLLESELQVKIEEAILSLPETQRLALVLRRYEEFSYEEIAQALDVSVPAVKSLLFRARTELRQRLKNYLKPE
jgi:RNA polymerase sigma-70 factor (ECF subfamily)